MMYNVANCEEIVVNDLWRYKVKVYKDEWVQQPLEYGYTHYVMAMNAGIKNGRYQIADSMFAAQCNLPTTIECWDKDSTVVDISFYGLSMNDDRIFFPEQPLVGRSSCGNLSYMDGGTNTTAVNPGRLGFPVINYVHFPAGMKQTLHTHPSQRIGLILQGSGEIELDNGKFFPIETGDVFVMERNTLHNFMCSKGEDVMLFVFAPDSGTGPTDEVNPLKVRTYVGQQRF